MPPPAAEADSDADDAPDSSRELCLDKIRLGELLDDAMFSISRTRTHFHLTNNSHTGLTSFFPIIAQ